MASLIICVLGLYIGACNRAAELLGITNFFVSLHFTGHVGVNKSEITEKQQQNYYNTLKFNKILAYSFFSSGHHF